LSVISAQAGIQFFFFEKSKAGSKWMTSHAAVENRAFVGMTAI
jgi:hypothetical protein